MLKYVLLMVIAYHVPMAYSSINEYEARGTNNLVYCSRMLHVADETQRDATNNYVQYCIQNIISATPKLVHVSNHRFNS